MSKQPNNKIIAYQMNRGKAIERKWFLCPDHKESDRPLYYAKSLSPLVNSVDYCYLSELEINKRKVIQGAIDVQRLEIDFYERKLAAQEKELTQLQEQLNNA